MNRFLKTVIAACVLTAWGTFPSCIPEVSADAQIQREAADLQERTVPLDSHLLAHHSLALQGWIASADWEFLSNYSADAYYHWVTSKLRADFQIHETSNSYLQFSKDADGDVETLSIKTAPSSGMLRVAVKLEIYPD